MTNTDFLSALPLILLLGYTSLLLLADLFIPAERKAWTGYLALLGLGVTGAGMLPWPILGQWTTFNGMLVTDNFAVFLNVIFLGSGAFAILLAQTYLKRTGIERGEFYVLLLFTIAGMLLMTQANDLIIVFLAIELLSIPLYILSGFARPRLASEEAAMKYFLLGAFASAFLLYGIALVYGATATTNLTHILTAARETSRLSNLLMLGAAMILVGLGFKVAAAPFHMWTPDVYDGAPSVVTAFMSVGAKVGGFAALLRVFVVAFPDMANQWAQTAALLAALTMIVGNFSAILQSNIKRMLAYSSIAHAGYILMGVVAAGTSDPTLRAQAIGATLFYLLAYAITNTGTWAVVMAIERTEGEGLTLDDYAGLGQRRVGLGVAMALFMFSLTGMPLTVGFMAKAYVFSSAIEAGYFGLALVGVFTSLVSAYYYLRVIVIMFMREGEGRALTPKALNFTVAVTAIATFVLGIVPTPFFMMAANAVQTLVK